MIIAHIMMPQGEAGVLFIGFPSALFAVLAGVSLSIMSTRGVREGGTALASSRHALMVRGALLIVIHQLIDPFSGDISVVLQAFGICYIALACVPRWTNRALAVLLLWLAVASAVVHAVSFMTVLPPFLVAPYPAVTWAAYMVVGVLVHRLLVVASVPAQAMVAAAGLLAAVTGTYLSDVVNIDSAFQGSRDRLLLLALINPETHTGSFVDLVSATGGALVVISLSLIAGRAGRWLYPLQAMGSMSLTVYVVHVLTAGAVLTASGPTHFPVLAVGTVLGSMAVAMIIRTRFNHGPLEWAVRRIVQTVSCTTLPPRPALGRSGALRSPSTAQHTATDLN